MRLWYIVVFWWSLWFVVVFYLFFNLFLFSGFDILKSLYFSMWLNHIIVYMYTSLILYNLYMYVLFKLLLVLWHSVFSFRLLIRLRYTSCIIFNPCSWFLLLQYTIWVLYSLLLIYILCYFAIGALVFYLLTVLLLLWWTLVHFNIRLKTLEFCVFPLFHEFVLNISVWLLEINAREWRK
jgi:hypothetical protein